MRELAEFLNSLTAEIVDMERAANIVNEGEIIGGAVDNVGEVAGEFDCLGDDGWYDNSNKGANEADDN